MAAGPEQYRVLFEQLLPPGGAMAREDGSTTRGVLAALAEEFARADCRADDLVDEADARTTSELITDWERVAGLPDECSDLGDTLQLRRAALVAKITARGGQSRRFFIDVAAALGFAVTITEFRPFQTGVSTAGEALYDEDWRFAWRVNGPETTVREFRTGESAAGEPLRDWGNDLLECVLARVKPAQTALQFAYGG